MRHARQKLAVRILLRGMEGFGHRHHLCTDTSLTLSEDLPLAAIAVDTRPNIETVLDQALELTRHGLITLERARLLSDEIDPVGIVDHAAKPPGCVSFSAATTGVYGVSAVEVICELLHRRGIVGAAVLPGVDGTAHGRHQRPQFFSRNAGAPMIVTAVDSGDRIGLVLPELDGLVRRPLITWSRSACASAMGSSSTTRKRGRGPVIMASPRAEPHRLHLRSRQARGAADSPRNRARLRSAGISSATAHCGIWGFHGGRPPHGDHFLQLGRHVPVVATVIDTADRIPAAFGIIDKLTSERGLARADPPGQNHPNGGMRSRPGS